MDKEFYYLEGKEQKGPFTVDQLKTLRLMPDTLVWTDEFDNWKSAKDVEELKGILRKMPPPPPIIDNSHSSTFQTSEENQEDKKYWSKNDNEKNAIVPQKKRSNLEIIIRIILLVWLILGVSSIVVESETLFGVLFGFLFLALISIVLISSILINKTQIWLCSVLIPIMPLIIGTFIFLFSGDSHYLAGIRLGQCFLPALISGVVIYFQLNKNLKKRAKKENLLTNEVATGEENKKTENKEFLETHNNNNIVTNIEDVFEKYFDKVADNNSSENGILFNKSKTVLIEYPSSKIDTSYTIPNGVTNIEDDAFFSCKNLISVTIPDSVTKIGNRAFMDCTQLKNIYLQKETPPTIGDFTFGEENVCMLHVPIGSKSKYENADGWKEFKNIQVFRMI